MSVNINELKIGQKVICIDDEYDGDYELTLNQEYIVVDISISYGDKLCIKVQRIDRYHNEWIPISKFGDITYIRNNKIDSICAPIGTV